MSGTVPAGENAERPVMLKSIGATMAQVTQRLRADVPQSELGRYDRAQHVAHRAARRRRLKTVVGLSVSFAVMVGVFSSAFHELMDREGRTVMVGALDDPRAHHNARVAQAAMVVATQDDQTNTNIAFTVREIAPNVDIVASADSPASVDILEIAGANRVFQLGEALGAWMAARTLELGGQSHVIGSFAGLQIAEAGAIGTDLAEARFSEVFPHARHRPLFDRVRR